MFSKQPPQPSYQWIGKKIFAKEANICVQMSYTYTNVSIVGSEDCLYLNVYTKKLKNKTKYMPIKLMPVMVWIHGGSFNLGSAGSDADTPDYIVEKVITNINIKIISFYVFFILNYIEIYWNLVEWR